MGEFNSSLELPFAGNAHVINTSRRLNVVPSNLVWLSDFSNKKDDNHTPDDGEWQKGFGYSKSFSFTTDVVTLRLPNTLHRRVGKHFSNRKCQWCCWSLSFQFIYFIFIGHLTLEQRVGTNRSLCFLFMTLDDMSIVCLYVHAHTCLLEEICGNISPCLRWAAAVLSFTHDSILSRRTALEGLEMNKYFFSLREIPSQVLVSGWCLYAVRVFFFSTLHHSIRRQWQDRWKAGFCWINAFVLIRKRGNSIKLNMGSR